MDAREEFLEAVRSGDAGRVRELVAADPSAAAVRDDDGLSAVLHAQYGFHHDIVEILLAADPNLDVFEAAALGMNDRLAELLDADPGAVSMWSPDGFTPLHLAAFFGHPVTVRLLLNRGAEVGTASRNPMRVTPLHSAAAGGRHAVAEALLAHGADVNARQEGGFRPLHSAAENGDVRMVELLLSRGADPAAADDAGRTPLDLASEKGQTEVLGLLQRYAKP